MNTSIKLLSDESMDHMVFVYGSLKRGFGNHSRYLGQDHGCYLGDYITEPKYTMYSLGSFPAVVKGGVTPITGEIFAVNKLSRLDSLEGHPTFYKREEIDTPYGKVWAYFLTYVPKRSRVVESGLWTV